MVSSLDALRSLLVPRRRSDPEWMEQPGNSPPEIERTLREIRWVNRSLGGSRALLRGIGGFLEEAPPGEGLEILDVGTGGGDLAARMVEEGRSRGLRVRVTAVDRDPVAAALAARETPEGVRVLRADAFALPFPDRSFDLVTASLFLHHFRPPEASALLASFLRLARRGVVINELRRHRIPWAFISVAARARQRSPMFVHDSALSVLRGFTAAELLALARDAGSPRARLERSFPFRLVLILTPGGGRVPPASS